MYCSPCLQGRCSRKLGSLLVITGTLSYLVTLAKMEIVPQYLPRHFASLTADTMFRVFADQL